MDDIASSLTIIHVYEPRHTLRSDAQSQLDAFFAESDRYGRTTRVLLPGNDPARCIASYLHQHPHDLLLCLAPRSFRPQCAHRIGRHKVPTRHGGAEMKHARRQQSLQFGHREMRHGRLTSTLLSPKQRKTSCPVSARAFARGSFAS